MIRTLTCTAMSFALAVSAATAQINLTAGDTIVATMDGVFRVVANTGFGNQTAIQLYDPGSPTNGLPGGKLINPAIAWQPGTDNLVVTSGPGIYWLPITNGSGINTLNTNSPIAFNIASSFVDVEFDPATHDIWVLDAATGIASAVTANGIPVWNIQLQGVPQHFDIDARTFPPALVYASDTGIWRTTIGYMPPTTAVSGLTTASLSSMMLDPRLGGLPFLCERSTSTIAQVTAGPLFDINICNWQTGGIAAIGPRALGWDDAAPQGRSVVVLADAVDPNGCMQLPNVSGLQVIRIRPTVGVAQAQNLTVDSGHSGITGRLGDLDVVRHTGVSAVYGPWPSCQFSSGLTPVLEPVPGPGGNPNVNGGSFSLRVSGGPPGGTVRLFRTTVPNPHWGLLGFCHELVPPEDAGSPSDSNLVWTASLNAAGTNTYTQNATGSFSGVAWYYQAVITDGPDGEARYTNAVASHFGY